MPYLSPMMCSKSSDPSDCYPRPPRPQWCDVDDGKSLRNPVCSINCLLKAHTHVILSGFLGGCKPNKKPRTRRWIRDPRIWMDSMKLRKNDSIMFWKKHQQIIKTTLSQIFGTFCEAIMWTLSRWIHPVKRT